MNRLVLLLALCLTAISVGIAERRHPDPSAFDLIRQARNSATFPGARTAPAYCCKVCTTGKACGDTCISRDKVCRVGPGCACDG